MDVYRSYSQATMALDAIQELLDGVEWNANTLAFIVDIIRETGRRVADVS